MELTQFLPKTSGGVPFQFQPELDGQQYNASVTWNAGGKRWFISLISPTGLLVFHQALSGSPIGIAIQSLYWQDQQVFGTTVVPHLYRVGDTIELVVNDCVPDTFNGRQRLLLTGPQTFEYPLASDPGDMLRPGVISYDIDLLAGYGFGSTLVYREANAMFEIRP
jgi:hypothetical protein